MFVIYRYLTLLKIAIAMAAYMCNVAAQWGLRRFAYASQSVISSPHKLAKYLATVLVKVVLRRDTLWPACNLSTISLYRCSGQPSFSGRGQIDLIPARSQLNTSSLNLTGIPDITFFSLSKVLALVLPVHGAHGEVGPQHVAGWHDNVSVTQSKALSTVPTALAYRRPVHYRKLNPSTYHVRLIGFVMISRL